MTMSDSSSKPSIPSWQRAQSTTPTSAAPPDTSDTASEQTESKQEPGAEEAIKEDANQVSPSETKVLLEQASKFLDDPTIRDAPRHSKVAFLQSKGVEMNHITELLGSGGEITSASDFKKEGERAWSNRSKATSSVAPSKPQSRDVPPIVTYPEFLTQSSKPPPLITARRIATTAYIAGALATSVYALSKYIVSPMTETLADSRHDFASHTQEQLAELNARLGKIVSTDPATHKSITQSDPADDISEADSDPTELFHRDYGTQTTPNLSRRPSVSENASAENTSTVGKQEDRLKILTSHLRELEATHSNDSASSDSLRTQLTDLHTYLSDMSYSNQYYNGLSGMYGGSSYGTPKTKDGKDDQVEALKADIRAVKGVLLSARNFPAGGARTAGRVGGA